MKFRLIVFLVALSTSHLVQAQNKNTLLASVTYKVKFAPGNVTKIDDVCQLDISKSQSYFYSLGVAENSRVITDKYRVSEQTGTPVKLTYKDLKRNLFKFTTIKNYQTKLVALQELVGSQSLAYVVDTINTKGWKISGESTKINNFNCRKAEITKGTTKITAWFCADIPFHDGPIYAAGLPGLIVKFTTSSGWNAELSGIQYNKDSRKEIKISPYSLVTEAKFNKAKSNNKAMSKDGVSPNGDKMEKVKN